MNLFGRRATCDEQSVTGSALALGVYTGWAAASNDCEAQTEEEQGDSVQPAEARQVEPDPAATAADGAWSNSDGGSPSWTNLDVSGGG